MKIRSLGLVLALGFALTAVAEAKKKPPVYRAAQKSRKSSVRKYKPVKHKVSKATVKRRKHTA